MSYDLHYLLHRLEDLHKDLTSVKTKATQAIGNAKYSARKLLGRNHAENKHASKWGALHEYYRSKKYGACVKLMDTLNAFSAGAEDPDPAHYFNQLLLLVRNSDITQQDKIESPFWVYYRKQCQPEYREPWQPNDPYDQPEDVLIENFLNAVREAQTALEHAGAEVEVKEAADLTRAPIVHQRNADIHHRWVAAPSSDRNPKIASPQDLVEPSAARTKALPSAATETRRYTRR